MGGDCCVDEADDGGATVDTFPACGISCFLSFTRSFFASRVTQPPVVVVGFCVVVGGAGKNPLPLFFPAGPHGE